VAHRISDNITSAKDDCILSSEIDPGFFEQSHDTLGGAGHEKGLAASFCELSNVGDAKAVDILLVDNCRSDCVLGNMGRDGQLNEDSMNSWVIVELLDVR